MVEPVLVRAIMKRLEQSKKNISEMECKEIIDQIFEEMSEDVRNKIVGEYTNYHKKISSNLSYPTLFSQGMSVFEPAWKDRTRRFDMVGGKDFISALAVKLHKRYSVSVTIVQIINEMRTSEVPSDLAQAIESMEVFF